MFDDHGDGPQVFDFDELANHLLEQGLENSPSQLHGALCGLLAAGAAAEPEHGLAAASQALGADLFGELAEQTMQLYRVSAATLMDEEFQFYPLLPDDDTEVDVRTEALGQWCSGFLSGYGFAATEGEVSETGREILTDLAAIAEAGIDDEADEEDNEHSYAEIVEYLRFAVLNLFMENLAPEADGDDVTLH